MKRKERHIVTLRGRPKKYKSAAALEKAVRGYLTSISRTVQPADALGEPILNDEGVPIETTEYIVPPSVSGLCLYLGIDRRTWRNYCDEEMHPEMREVTAYVRLVFEAYLEEQLLTRTKGLQGIMFNLQNNYGWREKKEVELGGATRSSMMQANMTTKEKLEFLVSFGAAVGEVSGDEKQE